MPDDLVIFDLDDTLLDTSRGLRAARRRILETAFPGCERGQLVRAAVAWRATTLLYGDDRLHELLGVVAMVADLPLDRSLDWEGLRADYRRWQVGLTRPRTPVLLAARALKADGKGLAIVSNGEAGHQWEKIRRTGLDSLADAELIVVCDGRTLPLKPSPVAIHQVIRAAAARRAVLVGDRMTDVVAARLAGIPVVQIRSRGAEVERGVPLRRLTKPDILADSAGCYDAVTRVLDGRT
ncbi:HAD family hydrolase [Planotetraspora sp. A-T 1434]|uniref:HAD family hydrolase n=1 Tax=Planotetraspora sp. A-T 1434 TaxID=2979219 RepID=UPI0021C01C8B|nr:HAD family hydrolase [Planotetraspora sp. A-T 1434]MCT9929136.1 HAD family hydrolase [Planotetraspora sp. A-T 1434]